MAQNKLNISVRDKRHADFIAHRLIIDQSKLKFLRAFCNCRYQFHKRQMHTDALSGAAAKGKKRELMLLAFIPQLEPIRTEFIRFLPILRLPMRHRG